MGFLIQEQKELVEMMYGPAAEDYLLILDSLGDFFEKEIEPTARQIDVKAEFPRENIQKLFEQGFTRDVRKGLREHRPITRNPRHLLRRRPPVQQPRPEEGISSADD